VHTRALVAAWQVIIIYTIVGEAASSTNFQLVKEHERTAAQRTEAGGAC
jgi:hypothetical protein